MLQHIVSLLFAPGLLQSPPVRTALLMGSFVAVASAVVGVFVVVRGQAFLGHALGDMGSTGGSGAALFGIGALWGFLAGGLVAGSAVDLGSGAKPRDRDVTTGIVLSAMLGLGALFLYLVTVANSQTSITQTILFGSIFAASPGLWPTLAVLSALAVGLVVTLYRPLLFSTAAHDLAQARAVRVRLVSYLFLLATVIAVEQSALVTGALLSTCLVVGPAATALRLTRTMAGAFLTAIAISLGVVFVGIILAYDSYNWPPVDRGWPVSFFVTALTLVAYLFAQFARRGRKATTPAPARAGAAS